MLAAGGADGQFGVELFRLVVAVGLLLELVAGLEQLLLQGGDLLRDGVRVALVALAARLLVFQFPFQFRHVLFEFLAVLRLVLPPPLRLQTHTHKTEHGFAIPLRNSSRRRPVSTLVSS